MTLRSTSSILRSPTVGDSDMAHPIETFHPQSSGDFLSQNFELYSVDRIKSVDTDASHFGVTFHQDEYTISWETEEGKEESNKYLVTSSTIPKHRQKDASDIASVETSAWLTHFGGLNKRRQIALARDFRIPSTFIGVQQNTDKLGNIEDNVHNHLFIAAHVAEQFGRDQANLILNGISRGAMHGLATQAIAGEHTMNVIYSDNIVPCFPDGLNPRTDLIDFLRFLPNEVNSLRALKMPLHIFRHYPETLDLSVSGMFQQLKEVPTLLSGRIGELIDDAMPHDSFGYIAAYGGDIMSQGNRWVDKIDSRFPNMTVDLSLDGAHLSCISSGCHSEWRVRMQTITDLLHEDRTRVGIGATALSALAVGVNSTNRKHARNQLSVVT